MWECDLDTDSGAHSSRFREFKKHEKFSQNKKGKVK